MKYEVLWTTDKVANRAELVMNFWEGVARGAKEKIAALPTADREDKTHIGMPAKLRRMAEAASAQAWRAKILLTEAKDLIGAQRLKEWTFTSEDMLWFYPELATSEDNLLQLGL